MSELLNVENLSSEVSKALKLSDLLSVHPRDKATNMMNAFLAFLEKGYDWNAVIEAKVISQNTLVSYLKCPVFRAKLDSLGPIREQIAESVYMKAMAEAPWSEKIKAADRILASINPTKYDAGVRKANAQAKTNVLTTLLSKLDSSEVKKHIENNMPRAIGNTLAEQQDSEAEVLSTEEDT